MEALARQEDTVSGVPSESSYQTPFRPQPTTVDDTGVDFGQLVDLCVKTIHYRGRPSAREICEAMALPFSVMEDILGFLKREKFIEVIGSVGLGEQQYQYSLSDKGVGKADEALAGNQYLGPAPVPYEDWLQVVHQQSIRNLSVDAATVNEAMSEMVLNKTTRDLVGPGAHCSSTETLVTVRVRSPRASAECSRERSLSPTRLMSAARQSVFSTQGFTKRLRFLRRPR